MNEPIPPQTPPKDPNLTAILNLLFSGAGYFYLGQWQKGIAAVMIGGTMFLATLILITMCIGIVLLPVCIVYPLAIAYDGWKQAMLLGSGRTLGQWTFLDRAL